MNDTSASPRRFWGKAWFVYTAAVLAGSLLVLAIYVNAYDDYGVSPKLAATGSVTRSIMQALSFPLGFPVGALADPLLERSFGCEAQSEPCSTFAAWWTRFAAVLMQILLLRWLVRRG